MHALRLLITSAAALALSFPAHARCVRPDDWTASIQVLECGPYVLQKDRVNREQTVTRVRAEILSSAHVPHGSGMPAPWHQGETADLFLYQQALDVCPASQAAGGKLKVRWNMPCCDTPPAFDWNCRTPGKSVTLIGPRNP